MTPPNSAREVWFLTGSQGLYGPETLDQVAAQSRAGGCMTQQPGGAFSLPLVATALTASSPMLTRRATHGIPLGHSGATENKRKPARLRHKGGNAWQGCSLYPGRLTV
jgi:hypothetical protein